MRNSKRAYNNLEALSVSRVRELSAEQFVKFSEERGMEIKHVSFVPPKLGSAGFGFFKVETKTPHYEVACFD